MFEKWLGTRCGHCETKNENKHTKSTQLVESCRSRTLSTPTTPGPQDLLHLLHLGTGPTTPTTPPAWRQPEFRNKWVLTYYIWVPGPTTSTTPVPQDLLHLLHLGTYLDHPAPTKRTTPTIAIARISNQMKILLQGRRAAPTTPAPDLPHLIDTYPGLPDCDFPRSSRQMLSTYEIDRSRRVASILYFDCPKWFRFNRNP